MESDHSLREGSRFRVSPEVGRAVSEALLGHMDSRIEGARIGSICRIHGTGHGRYPIAQNISPKTWPAYNRQVHTSCLNKVSWLGWIEPGDVFFELYKNPADTPTINFCYFFASDRLSANSLLCTYSLYAHRFVAPSFIYLSNRVLLTPGNSTAESIQSISPTPILYLQNG